PRAASFVPQAWPQLRLPQPLPTPSPRLPGKLWPRESCATGSRAALVPPATRHRARPCRNAHLPPHQLLPPPSISALPPPPTAVPSPTFGRSPSLCASTHSPATYSHQSPHGPTSLAPL